MAITEATVGSWVARDEEGSKWHKAQSIFHEEVLTKCGKFMPESTAHGDELLVKNPSPAGVTVKPSTLCKICFLLP
jgi:hypothetical protein